MLLKWSKCYPEDIILYPVQYSTSNEKAPADILNDTHRVNFAGEQTRRKMQFVNNTSSRFCKYSNIWGHKRNTVQIVCEEMGTWELCTNTRGHKGEWLWLWWQHVFLGGFVKALAVGHMRHTSWPRWCRWLVRRLQLATVPVCLPPGQWLIFSFTHLYTAIFYE